MDLVRQVASLLDSGRIDEVFNLTRRRFLESKRSVIEVGLVLCMLKDRWPAISDEPFLAVVERETGWSKTHISVLLSCGRVYDMAPEFARPALLRLPIRALRILYKKIKRGEEIDWRRVVSAQSPSDLETLSSQDSPRVVFILTETGVIRAVCGGEFADVAIMIRRKDETDLERRLRHEFARRLQLLTMEGEMP